MKASVRLKVGDVVYVKGLQLREERAVVKETTCGSAKPKREPSAMIQIVSTGAKAEFPQSWLTKVAA